MENDEPVFPLKALYDDGDSYVFDEISEVACTLEFCDTRDKDACNVYGNLGRPVTVVVKWLEIKTFEIE